MKNIFSYIAHPLESVERLRWKKEKRNLLSCGTKSSMAANFTLRGAKYITIGENTHFGRNCQIAAYDFYGTKKMNNSPQITIGSHVTAMDNCQISCANKISIGDGTLLGDNVFITDNYHGNNSADELEIEPINRDLYAGKGIYVGKNVWIGRNVCIMPGVTIGDSAVIGANAVVTHDVPPCCIAAGVPAKIIRNMGNDHNNEKTQLSGNRDGRNF